jgi:cysteine-rich repeat protein
MGTRGALAGPVLVTLAALGVPSARADVDLTGTFLAEFTGQTFPVSGANFSCLVVVAQTGTSIGLSFDGACAYVGGLTATGTIDPATGEFAAAFPGSPSGCVPGTAGIGGVGAPDGRSFTGGAGCLFPGLLEPVRFDVFASTCGNTILEPGEECDDGNRAAGDCCSATCSHDPPGTRCAADTNGCTDDVCDGAGACTHPPNTEACEDGNDCTVGDACSGGACVPGPAAAAGAPCNLDADLCTVDQCDGAGTCTATGGSLTCDPCSRCDPAHGCVADPDFTCKGPDFASSVLSMRDLEPATKDRVSWSWGRGSADATEFGSPTSSTDYLFCVYALVVFPPSATVVSATVPASAGWSETSRGFRFRSKSDGVRKIDLVSGSGGRARVKVRGRGAALGMPQALPGGVQVAQLKTSDGRCFGAGLHRFFSPRKVSSKVFLGVAGSPSGAFVE